MSTHAPGRHRAPARPNPVTEFSAGVLRSSLPAAQATAVLAVSGGLVASTMAAPASAHQNPQTAAVSTVVVPEVAPIVEAVIPEVAPVVTTVVPAAAPAVAAVKVTAVKATAVKVAAVKATTVKAATVKSTAVGKSALSSSVALGAGGGVLMLASRLTGIWYHWGGTTPRGFDCSGFTSYIYKRLGIRIPRTARAQQRFAKRVSNPIPGDLVFFGYPAHHVAIYAGHGMMYDSPHRGKKTSLRKIYSSRVTYGRVV